MGDSVFDLGMVEDVRIRVAYAAMIDGPADDVYSLDLSLTDGEVFEERPYFDALEPLLYVGGAEAAPHSVHLNRSHNTWTGAGDAEIVIALSATTAPETDGVRDAFRKILADSGRGAAPPLKHDEAIAEACMRVEQAHFDVHSDRLVVSQEEHRVATGVWSVGLVAPDLARFTVEIGFVDGNPSTTHIHRVAHSEVVDSVGVS